jgi:hypothetical protein
MESPDGKPLISRVDAAAEADRDPRTIDRWSREGKLTRYKASDGTVWVDPDELTEYLRTEVAVPTAEVV